jgi:hypothetical protein
MSTRPQSSRAVGVGRVLIAVYAILALAATARSTFQLVTKFDVAPIAYLLSAFAGVIYIVATIALVKRGAAWFRVALVTITIELIGVLVVGTITVMRPDLLPADTVWSYFGKGYLFIPLVLPVLGLLWLSKNRPDREEA